MSEEKSEFYKKIKDMSLEDLWKYEGAAKYTANFVAAVGVLFILAMLMYPNIIILAIGIPSVYLLSKMAMGIGLSRIDIEELIEKKTK